MRQFFCSLMAALLCFEVSAQLPQYKTPYVKLPGGGVTIGTSDTIHPSRLQIIYKPQDFGSVKAGNISAVYLRYRNIASVDTNATVYYNLMINLGHTERQAWRAGNVTDTFATGLSSFYSSPIYARDFKTDSPGTWIKFPANAGNFAYNGSSNFIVEVAYGPKRTVTPITFTANGPGLRTIGGRADTFRCMNCAASMPRIDFGFDLAPTSVDAVHNITSFGLFPNPVTDGRLAVSFDAQAPVQETAVRVSDATGRQVYSQAWRGGGTSFFRELRLGDMAKGIYFVEVMADGERINRRIVVQ